MKFKFLITQLLLAIFLSLHPALLAGPDDFKQLKDFYDFKTLQELEETVWWSEQNYPEIPLLDKHLDALIYQKDFSALIDMFIIETERQLADFGISNKDGHVGHASSWHLTPEDHLFVVGDIHGSYFTLLRQLRRWVIEGVLNEDLTLNPGCSLIFIGDYVDRTKYSVECLALLLCLKMLNFDRVILLRGNHEWVEINRYYGAKGLIREIMDKYLFNEPEGLIEQLDTLYSCFALTHYVRCGGAILQFCHGAPEPKFDPKELLLSSQASFKPIFLKDLYNPIVGVYFSHYLWTDIIHHDPERAILVKQNCDNEAIEESLRRKLFSKSNRGNDIHSADLFAVECILNNQQVDALIRGHQDSIAVLKLFRDKEINIDADLLRKPFEDPKNRPLDWKEVVSGESPQFYMQHYGPVFTVSTVSGSKLNSEGCVEIILAETYDACAMKVYDYPLRSIQERTGKRFLWVPSGRTWPQDPLNILLIPDPVTKS